MADGDPARPELERRQAELLPGYPQGWARPFRRRGARAWGFAGGLVDSLTLRPAEFDRMAELIVREQPVRRLRLLGGGWSDRLRDWPGLPRLRALEFDSSAIEGNRLLRSRHLAGLRELSLPPLAAPSDLRNAACAGSLERLAVRFAGDRSPGDLFDPTRLPRLVALRTNSLHGAGELLPQLLDLTLTGVNLGIFVSMARKAKPPLGSLTLEGCQQATSLAAVFRLDALAGLRSLALRDLPLSGVPTLGGLLERGLTRLVLHNAVVLQLGLLAGLGKLGQLRELAVTRTPDTPLSLPEGHAGDLADVSMPALTSLSLSGYDLRLNDVLDLLGASWMDRLHTLTLRDCNLNPHAVSVIVGREWPRLAWLDLRGNWLGAEANARLRGRFGNRVRYSS
jgi:hypothetical protein